MSRSSTIVIQGCMVGENNHDTILKFIETQGGSVDIDGFVQGAVVEEDGMDFVMEPINGRAPIAVARSMLHEGRLSTLDCFFDFNGERRYFNFDAHYGDRLVVTINANRIALEDGATDFNWHYNNLVSKLSETVIEPKGVAFCDDL